MATMPPLDVLRCLTLLSGTAARPGGPLTWYDCPARVLAGPRQGLPLYGGALLRGGAVIAHRHPHVFLIEPDGTAWQFARPAPRAVTFMRRGRRVSFVQTAGSITLPWHRARVSMWAAVRRAAAKRAGTYPVSGDPGSYALSDGRQQAAWLPWTDQDEADYLARLPLKLARRGIAWRQIADQAPITRSAPTRLLPRPR